MKAIFLIIFGFALTDALAQTQPSPHVYLNAARIDFENVYIKPSNIADIRVEKESAPGEVYITTTGSLTFLTLDDVLRENTDIVDSDGRVVYIVNDRLIADKSTVKIDDSYFLDVKVTRLDKLSYVDKKHRSLILVEVTLLNEKRQPVIRIRGDEGIHAKN